MLTESAHQTTPGSRPAASALDYLRLARLDHWVKQIFVLPGFALAALLSPEARIDFTEMAGGLLSACMLASANYVLNEWLDRHKDALHPLKSQRPAVQLQLRPLVVYGFYVVLLSAGLYLAASLNRTFLAIAVMLAVFGLLYNVPPVRFKDTRFIDVLVESFNNPLRLALGWAVVDSTTLPPSSLLLSYWAGGGFLMTIKRLAERRFVTVSEGLKTLQAYRPAIATVSERAMLLAAVVYALVSTFALTVFLVKYRIEYLLLLPIVIALLVSYLSLGLKTKSPVQTPEVLWRQRRLMGLLAFLVLAFAVLTWVDLPFLERLAEPHYIRLS